MVDALLACLYANGWKVEVAGSCIVDQLIGLKVDGGCLPARLNTLY